MNYFIYWYDYALLPIYLGGCLLLLNGYFATRSYASPELKRYFIRGMWIKFVGCIAIGMIYEYYYLGAYDGRFFFEGGKMLSKYYFRHPAEIFNVLTSDIIDFNANNLDGISMYDVNIFAQSSFNVTKVAGILNVISFNAFLPCSLLFCTLAYLAIWNLFIFFIRNYNLTYKVAAYCTIYIPSILMWDSSIFKDTVTFTCLCWLFICGYYTFIKPQKILNNIIGLAISVTLIVAVKVYILAAFMPLYIFYIFSALKSKISNKAVRSLITPVVLTVSIVSVLVIMRNLGDLLGNYALDNVVETAGLTYNYIADLSAGSAYTLNVDYGSFGSILKSLPAGINVTLFRPYPWEYLKPFTLLASAESMAILFFTVKVLRAVKLKGFFRSIINEPTIQFCFFFSVLFAFMVGISASNFGTLVRYKIPVLPFYTLFLALLYQRYFPNDPAVSRVVQEEEEDEEEATEFSTAM